MAQLPLSMVYTATLDGSGGIGGMLWAGFCVPAVVYTLKGAHQLLPAVPDVLTHLDLGTVLPREPWSALGFAHVFVSFAAIGFVFMLPADLVFSLWFFFVLPRLVAVWAGLRGITFAPMPMFGIPLWLGYQNMGAYIALAGWIAWSARSHLGTVFRAVMQGAACQGDELLTYRAAAIGLAVCSLGATVWLVTLGMAFWIAALAFGLFLLVVAVVMARSTAEGGMLMTETSWLPTDFMRLFGDPARLGAANLTALAFFDTTWARDQRGLLLSTFLDSMKIADGTRMPRRSLAAVFVVAVAVAALVTVPLQIYLPYRNGASNLYDYAYQGPNVWTFNEAATMLRGERADLAWYALPSALFGGVAVVALFWLRSRTLWFPLHPLGYALSGSWTMMVVWFPCFVAWLAKTVVLRYGGLATYAAARRFALGLVLGECTMAVLWSVASVLWDIPTPAFPWA